ncbi:MAG: hypothetical protein WBF56_14880, partial [Candidatus Acidiferrales bacterium]
LVLPLHPACSHEQSMSGVFSIASHCALQYLPDVVMQEHIGCAHFSDFSGLIGILQTADQSHTIQIPILVTCKN